MKPTVWVADNAPRCDVESLNLLWALYPTKMKKSSTGPPIASWRKEAHVPSLSSSLFWNRGSNIFLFFFDFHKKNITTTSRCAQKCTVVCWSSYAIVVVVVVVAITNHLEELNWRWWSLFVRRGHDCNFSLFSFKFKFFSARKIVSLLLQKCFLGERDSAVKCLPHILLFSNEKIHGMEKNDTKVEEKLNVSC